MKQRRSCAAGAGFRSRLFAIIALACAAGPAYPQGLIVDHTCTDLIVE